MASTPGVLGSLLHGWSVRAKLWVTQSPPSPQEASKGRPLGQPGAGHVMWPLSPAGPSCSLRGWKGPSVGLTKSKEMLHLMVFIASFMRRPHPSHSRQLLVASKTLPCTVSPGNLFCLTDAWPLLGPGVPRVPARGQLGAPFCTLNVPGRGEACSPVNPGKLTARQASALQREGK